MSSVPRSMRVRVIRFKGFYRVFRFLFLSKVKSTVQYSHVGHVVARIIYKMYMIQRRYFHYVKELLKL